MRIDTALNGRMTLEKFQCERRNLRGYNNFSLKENQGSSFRAKVSMGILNLRVAGKIKRQSFLPSQLFNLSCYTSLILRIWISN